MSSEATQLRRDFWTRYAELYPEDGVPSGWGRSHARVSVESADLHISLAVLGWGVGVWLRGRQGESPDAAETRLGLFKGAFQKAIGEALNQRLNFKPGTVWVEAAGGFDARREFDVNDPENWPHMAAWLHYMLRIYLRVIENALVEQD